MTQFETSISGVQGASYGPGPARQLITMTAIIAMTTAMIDNANDDVGLFYVPEGAVIVGAAISGTDMDTGGPTLTLDVGDAAVEDRIFAASAVGQAATANYSTAMAVAGFLYKYATRTQLRLYTKAAATTPAAGTVKVQVTYFVDPNFNTTPLVAA